MRALKTGGYDICAAWVSDVERRENKGCHKKREDALDVVVDDAVLVEEVDTREEGAEPALRVRLCDLDGDEPGVISPEDNGS